MPYTAKDPGMTVAHIVASRVQTSPAATSSPESGKVFPEQVILYPPKEI